MSVAIVTAEGARAMAFAREGEEVRVEPAFESEFGPYFSITSTGYPEPIAYLPERSCRLYLREA